MIEFKAMKFRVDSPEHSKKIQEKLFEMGYTWISGESTTAIHTSDPYIFTSKFGEIWFDLDYQAFEKEECYEYDLVEVVTYELKPVPKKDVVIFDGKEYNKAHFKELLKEVIIKL